MMISYVHTQDIQQSAIEIIKGFNGQPIESDQVTSYLLDIARNGHQLDINTKSRLEQIGFNFNQSLVSRSGAKRSESLGLDKYHDVKYFRIHYTVSGRNAVSPVDLNSNGIPDYIESLAEVFDYVSKMLHDEMGFVRPPSDGFYSPDYDLSLIHI